MRTFINDPYYGDPNMTSLQGYVITTYDELLEVFGPPLYGPDDIGDKTTCEWVLVFTVEGNEHVVTIYDYYSETETPRGLHKWHIGGHTKIAEELVNSEVQRYRTSLLPTSAQEKVSIEVQD